MSGEDPKDEQQWELQDEQEEDEEGEEDASEGDQDDETGGDMENGEDDENSEDEENGDEDEDGKAEYNDYEGDDIDPPPGDYDDPHYEGIDPRGQPAEYYQPEYNPDEEHNQFKDEPEEHVQQNWRERWGERWGERLGNRGVMISATLCCCFLILLAIALILSFLIVKDTNGSSSRASGSNNAAPAPTDPATFPTQPPQGAPVTPVPFSYPTPLPLTPAPSKFPTLRPTVKQPTDAPTIKPPTPSPSKYPTANPTTSAAPTQKIPDEIELIPVEDTYIVDGFSAEESHGAEDSFLVQQSSEFVREIPDSFALLKFDLSGVPFDLIQNRDLGATLHLTHQVSVRARGPATYTVARLPSTPLDVETLFLSIFPLPTDYTNGTTFVVAPTDENVTIDVSDLFFGGLYEPEDDNQALLMIANFGIDQNKGDRFMAREATGSEPKLKITMTRIPGVPDSTAAPSQRPSQVPTLAPNATGQATDLPTASGPVT